MAPSHLGLSHANALLPFAIRMYHHAPIQQACLQLQNNKQANILLILWLCWIEVQQLSLPCNCLNLAEDLQVQIAGKHIQQLRALRIRLKALQTLTSSEQKKALAAVLRAEIQLECQVLETLEHFTYRALNQPLLNQPRLTLAHYLSRLEILAASEKAQQFLNHCSDALKPTSSVKLSCSA